MKIQCSIFFNFLIFVFCAFGEASKIEGDYYNKSKLPVVIDIPYYEPLEIEPPKIRPGMKIQEYQEMIENPSYGKVKKEFRVIEQILQPNAFYQSAKGDNGLIFDDYEFDPEAIINLFNNQENQIAEDSGSKINASQDKSGNVKKTKIPSIDLPVFYFSAKEELDKIAENIRKGSSGDKMPRWWPDKYIKEYLSLTNINDRSTGLSLLSDPDKDMDGDGLGNRDEMLCGSDPLKKDEIVFKPAFLEFHYDDSSVLTGKFSAVNLGDTNLCFRVSLGCRDRDFRYLPRLECESAGEHKTNQFGNFVFTLLPKEEINLILLFDSKYLPNTLYPAYQVNLIMRDQYCAKLIPYIQGNHSSKPEPPSISHPRNWSRLATTKNLRFEWDSPEINKRNKLVKKCKYRKKVASVYSKLQFVRLGDNKSFCINTNDDEQPASTPEDRNYVQRDNIDLQPGNYLWRVIEQTALTDPTNSLWGWFSIGRKIYQPKDQPIKGSSYASGDSHFSRNSNSYYYIHDLTKGVAVDERNSHLYSLSNAYYAYPLPKGLALTRKNRDGYRSDHLSGTPEETGLFTNLWIGSQGETVVTQKHFFVIHEDRNKILSETFYHASKKALVHDLTVNVPFKFEGKAYYDEFYKKDGLEFDGSAETKFVSPLPQGIREERTADGDLALSGIPEVDGTFTNVFVLKNGKVSAEERHIFRIRDVHEPPQFKKYKRVFDKYYWQQINDYTVHFCYVGLSVDYNLPHDVFQYKRENYLKEFQYELLNNLPKGLNIDICESYPSDGKLPPLLSICGTLQEAGVYTNTIKYTLDGKTFERKHIFKVCEKPLEIEEYDVY